MQGRPFAVDGLMCREEIFGLPASAIVPVEADIAAVETNIAAVIPDFTAVEANIPAVMKGRALSLGSSGSENQTDCE